MKPTLIFDYDGTIHDTLHIYEPVMRETYHRLAQQGYVKEEPLSSARIAGWLGLNAKEMWDDFQPQLADEIKEQAAKRNGDGMVSHVRAHEARWYANARSTLDLLKQNDYPMIVLSNCKIGYREAHWDEFRMERWFDRFYDCESYGFAPKTQIIKEILPQYDAPYVVIGDREKDLACARAAGAVFVGCLYGYGSREELAGADILIKDIGELPEVLKKLENCRPSEE